MMGHYYETVDGKKCEFLGAIDFYTVGGKERMIGNYAFRLGEESGGSIVVGFENHSGRTHLGPSVSPFMKVVRGAGNNGEDGYEGARYKNTFCTYSHGSFLPKNARVTDMLLELALKRRYGESYVLPELDCEVEDLALNKALSYLEKH